MNVSGSTSFLELAEGVVGVGGVGTDWTTGKYNKEINETALLILDSWMLKILEY